MHGTNLGNPLSPILIRFLPWVEVSYPETEAGRFAAPSR